jgi:hypothetical protein
VDRSQREGELIALAPPGRGAKKCLGEDGASMTLADMSRINASSTISIKEILDLPILLGCSGRSYDDCRGRFYLMELAL